MADRTSLGFLGFVFGGVTVAVVLMACAVVLNHVEGKFVLDTPPTVAATVR
jgi:hypothetical protein